MSARLTASGRLPAFILVCLGLFHAPAAAAAPSDLPSRAPQAFHQFDIPAGPLDDVLAAFQAVTGLPVAVPPNASVGGLNSPGVSGTLTPEQALSALLSGTGLTFRLSGANAYEVEVQPVSERVEVGAALPYQARTSTTATRTLTPLRDVPQSATVVTRAMITDLGMQGMADVVRYVPGVVMAQGEGNRDTPVLRGNGTTADFFVDGIRDDVQYFRDLYNVERVEALKGPNAMIFGRGGAGGVINRATRQADWDTSREISIQAGANRNRRVTFDLDQPVTSMLAARLTAMYENSGSYRRGVALERYGLNPTLAFMIGGSTALRVGYERFHDDRTADRGIPSSGNRPVGTDPGTFFGDPDASSSVARIDAVTAGIDRNLGRGAVLRNRTRYADYGKFYQNVYPATAVSADGATVSLSAYNNATSRRNVFNQTDINFTARSGRVTHVLLAGAEFGRQVTDNLRNTGYFTTLGPTVTSYRVPVSAPTVSVPVTFRPSATDADNHGVAMLAAVYAQDQLELTRHVQAVVGIRLDRFDVDFRNNRTNAVLASHDTLVSPRVGLIVKPAEPASIYASYTLAHVPRAGEQLASLSVTSEALDPETFTNYEVGLKWDVSPVLSFTSAAYRLNRSNVVVPDPNDPARSLLVDGQRTTGFEADIAGRVTRAWSVVGAYAYQTGEITRTLSATAVAGARLAQLPAHTLSLWNRYSVSSLLGAGLGIIRSTDMFTSTDNTVVLPAFTRVDGALFVTLHGRAQLQVNVENLFDERYFALSHNNNNITPGAPRAIRITLTSRF